MKCFVLLLVFFSSTLAQLSQEQLCRELKAQESLDITKVLAKNLFEIYVIKLIKSS